MVQFIDLAKLGKNDWWRYLAALILIFVTYVAITIIVNTLVFLIGHNVLGINRTIISFIRATVFKGSLIIGLLLAMRFIHSRPFLTLITPHESIDWRKFGKSFLLFFSLLLLETLLYYILYPSAYVLRVEPATFLIFATIALILTPIQTTAEELLFRGYLLQSMAPLTRDRAGLVLASSVIFVLPHLANSEMSVGFGPMALYYFVFGVILTIITLRSNSLEMAMGVHTALNLHSTLLFDYAKSSLKTESLFYGGEPDPLSVVVHLGIMGLLFYVIMFGIRRTRKQEVTEN